MKTEERNEDTIRKLFVQKREEERNPVCEFPFQAASYFWARMPIGCMQHLRLSHGMGALCLATALHCAYAMNLDRANGPLIS